ncbi:MAG: hypothetical protein LUH15_10165 [Tannerellaceae bacterium]|nr:hypothetical protein [Tannerellaceae bacterium]
MSLEAILVFLKSTSGTKNYKNILSSKYKEEDIFKQRKDMEEIRIVYVACSRPKKILWIAVPDCDTTLWENKLFSKS